MKFSFLGFTFEFTREHLTVQGQNQPESPSLRLDEASFVTLWAVNNHSHFLTPEEALAEMGTDAHGSYMNKRTNLLKVGNKYYTYDTGVFKQVYTPKVKDA